MIKKVIVAAILLGCIIAKADQLGPQESWTIDGKTYTSKAQAIRAVVAGGKRVEIQHSRCEILTNKLTFKACPKNKLTSFDNEQFEGLKISK